MPVLKTRFLKSGFKQPSTGVGSDFSSTIANNKLDVMEGKGYKSQVLLEELIKEAEGLKGQFNTGTQSGRNAVSGLDKRIAFWQMDLKNAKNQKSEMAYDSKIVENDLSILQKDYASDPKNYFMSQVDRLDKAIEGASFKLKNAVDVGDEKSIDDYRNLIEEFKSQRKNIQGVFDVSKNVDENELNNVGIFVTPGIDGLATKVEYKSTADNSGFIETNKIIEIEGSKFNLWLPPVNASGGVQTTKFAGQLFKTKKIKSAEDYRSNVSGANQLFSESNESIMADHLRIRKHIPKDSWAFNKNSKTIYKALGNNRYCGYSGIEPDKLGLRSVDYQEIDDIWADRINRQVVSGRSIKPNFMDEERSVQEENVFGGGELLKTELKQPQEEDISPRFSGEQPSVSTPKEEKGSFFGTIKNIWKGAFKGKSKEEAISPTRSLPDFLDEI
jgi:hypothetical protein